MYLYWTCNSTLETFFRHIWRQLRRYLRKKDRWYGREKQVLANLHNRRRRHSSLNYQTPAQQKSYFYTTPMAA